MSVKKHTYALRLQLYAFYSMKNPNSKELARGYTDNIFKSSYTNSMYAILFRTKKSKTGIAEACMQVLNSYLRTNSW